MLKDSAEGSLTSASKKSIANTKEPRGSGEQWREWEKCVGAELQD